MARNKISVKSAKLQCNGGDSFGLRESKALSFSMHVVYLCSRRREPLETPVAHSEQPPKDWGR